MKNILISSFLLFYILLSCSNNENKKAEEDYINDILTYHYYYQEEAKDKVSSLLTEYQNAYPENGKLWADIINYWYEVNNMKVNIGVVPDGLEDNDTTAIVVLGFKLNDDGTMQDELKGRLDTAYMTAQKYTNVYVALTGGGTAVSNTNATEADLMAAYLIEKGIPESRIIVENKSKTTVENAEFTYAILREKYPNVNKIIMVTSHYHVPRGCLLYNTKLLLEAYNKKDEVIKIISNVGYDAGHEGYESFELQFDGVCQIMNQTDLFNKLKSGEIEKPAL
uniref:YdcF family protein n=1 Tax=Brachyspira catarrhinii TaxID=2528966 RepID=UPI003F4BC9B8